VVSFTLRPLYPQVKNPWFPLDRRLGGSQSRFGRRGVNSWPYRDSNLDPSVFQLVRSHYVDCAVPALCLKWYRNLFILNKACVFVLFSYWIKKSLLNPQFYVQDYLNVGFYIFLIPVPSRAHMLYRCIMIRNEIDTFVSYLKMIAILQSAIWTGLLKHEGGVSCTKLWHSAQRSARVMCQRSLREVAEQLEWWVTNPSQRRMEPLGLRATVAAAAPTTVARPTPTGPSAALLLLLPVGVHSWSVHSCPHQVPCMNFGLNKGNTPPTHIITITPKRLRDVRSLNV
jgi:hypothetical protein